MTSATRLIPIALAGVGLLLTGCGSSEDPVPVGKASSCGEISITETIQSQIGEDMAVRSIDGSGCDSGWLFAYVTVGAADGNTEGDVTETMVFEAEGQFWIPVDRTAVCGTPAADDPAKRPADAEVPESIWPMACNSN